MMHKDGFKASCYCNVPALILALCWICGLTGGVFYSLSTIDSYFTLMRMLPYQHVSIVGVVGVLFSFFVINLSAYRLFARYFLYMIVLTKAFVFGFCMCCVNLFYGTAGWLIYLLVSFSEICTAVPFIWLSLRSFTDARRALMRKSLNCLVLHFAVYIIDICCVSPYLAYIMTLI